MFRSQPEIAGIYSVLPRRIAGSPVIFPNAAKIPGLMKGYGEWLSNAEPAPKVSFDAHFRLAAIHPFADGNGRTARLLMNLLLLRDGYPPVAIRPEDRRTYLDTLEHASLHDDIKAFHAFLYQRLDTILGDYLIKRAGRGSDSGAAAGTGHLDAADIHLLILFISGIATGRALLSKLTSA